MILHVSNPKVSKRKHFHFWRFLVSLAAYNTLKGKKKKGGTTNDISNLLYGSYQYHQNFKTFIALTELQHSGIWLWTFSLLVKKVFSRDFSRWRSSAEKQVHYHQQFNKKQIHTAIPLLGGSERPRLHKEAAPFVHKSIATASRSQ